MWRVQYKEKIDESGINFRSPRVLYNNKGPKCIDGCPQVLVFRNIRKDNKSGEYIVVWKILKRSMENDGKSEDS